MALSVSQLSISSSAAAEGKTARRLVARLSREQHRHRHPHREGPCAWKISARCPGRATQPIVFENIVEKPGFRLCDILVKTRRSQGARARRDAGELPAHAGLSAAPAAARTEGGQDRAGQGGGEAPQRGRLDRAADPFHKDKDAAPYITAMNIIRDPETGFYNSCHAGTHAVGPRRGLISFVHPHSHVIMRKYLDLGMDEMPIAFVFGVPPAYEIMANFSGLHMDAWGEMEMVGTIMDRDVEMVPCETLELNVPAEAEIGSRLASI